MHWKAGFRFCGLCFFITQELNHIMYHPCEAPLIYSNSLLPSRLFRNAAGSLITGNVDIGKKPKLLPLPPVLAFGLAQALIPLSPLALFAKRMDVRHTGAGVGLICALKNCGKVTGTILSGWQIFRNDFLLTLCNMSALLAFWIFGL